MLFKVGEQFPGPVPSSEGAHLELWGDGLVCVIQMPGLTRPERQAFKKSFKQYGYLETSGPVPVAVWVFIFPKPFGEIDCSFSARPVKPENIENYLIMEDGRIKNALTFYLLDGPILKGMKLVGLEPAAVKLFHSTIQKQLDTDYTPADFDRYLNAVYNYTTTELFQMSVKFKK